MPPRKNSLVAQLTTHDPDIEGKTVYISGGITGVSGFKTRFARAAADIAAAHAKAIVNPADLPVGWTYAQYMAVASILIPYCDTIVALDGWADSPGASAEIALARALRKTVVAERSATGGRAAPLFWPRLPIGANFTPAKQPHRRNL